MLRDVLNRRQMRRNMELCPEDATIESNAAEPLIEAQIERLVGAGLIDDERFAESRARTEFQKGRGARKILNDLALKGVDRAIAQDAISTAARELTGTVGKESVLDQDVESAAEWEAADTYARKKKFGPYRTSPMPEDYDLAGKLWRREASSMARQGFGVDIIRQIIERDPEDDFTE